MDTYCGITKAHTLDSLWLPFCFVAAFGLRVFFFFGLVSPSIPAHHREELFTFEPRRRDKQNKNGTGYKNALRLRLGK